MMDVLNLAHGAVYLVGAYGAVGLLCNGPGLAAFVLAVLLAAVAGASRARPRASICCSPPESWSPRADEVAVMQKGQIVHRGSTTDFRGDRDRAHALLGVG